MRRRQIPPLRLLDVVIDGLTNSIHDVQSGASLSTLVVEVHSGDLRQALRKHGWRFNWHLERQAQDRKVFKLSLEHDPEKVQGLASISDLGDHIYLHLVESAPHNLGRAKRFRGVPANLFAFACRMSLSKGYGGCVAFQSKTVLIDHYEKTLGATHIGAHKMIIFEHASDLLIRRYFPDQNPESHGQVS